MARGRTDRIRLAPLISILALGCAVPAAHAQAAVKQDLTRGVTLKASPPRQGVQNEPITITVEYTAAFSPVPSHSRAMHPAALDMRGIQPFRDRSLTQALPAPPVIIRDAKSDAYLENRSISSINPDGELVHLTYVVNAAFDSEAAVSPRFNFNLRSARDLITAQEGESPAHRGSTGRCHAPGVHRPTLTAPPWRG